VKPAVVSITAKYLFAVSPQEIDTSSGARTLVISRGAGFFLSADGYVVTNHHVVEASRTAEIVTNDGTAYKAKVIASDPRSDLALLKIDGRNDFPFVELSQQAPRVGQRVFAVGDPFGFEGTVTAGVISALERHFDLDSDDDFIQIDAPINRGNQYRPNRRMAKRSRCSLPPHCQAIGQSRLAWGPAADAGIVPQRSTQIASRTISIYHVGWICSRPEARSSLALSTAAPKR
jgi:hypothetical protein